MSMFNRSRFYLQAIAILLVLVTVTALAVVYSSFNTRKLFIQLQALQAEHPGGYVHELFLHSGGGHNAPWSDRNPDPVALYPVVADPGAWLAEGADGGQRRRSTRSAGGGSSEAPSTGPSSASPDPRVEGEPSPGFRRSSKADRKSRRRDGDGARGDCGLGTAATKAASFDGDFC